MTTTEFSRVTIPSFSLGCINLVYPQTGLNIGKNPVSIAGNGFIFLGAHAVTLQELYKFVIL